MTERVLIAEINAKRGVLVQLFEGSMSFEVEASSGYRATLPTCVCEREPCLKKTCSARQHCHGHSGHHELHARDFLATIAKTYGATVAKRQPPPLKTGPRVRSISLAAWADTEWARRMERCVDHY
jgi:hypothetical protein